MSRSDARTITLREHPLLNKVNSGETLYWSKHFSNLQFSPVVQCHRSSLGFTHQCRTSHLLCLLWLCPECDLLWCLLRLWSCDRSRSRSRWSQWWPRSCLCFTVSRSRARSRELLRDRLRDRLLLLLFRLDSLGLSRSVLSCVVGEVLRPLCCRGDGLWLLWELYVPEWLLRLKIREHQVSSRKN